MKDIGNFGNYRTNTGIGRGSWSGTDGTSVGSGAYSAGLRAFISQVFVYFLVGLAICFGIATFVPTCSWYVPFMQKTGIGLAVAWLVLSVGFNFAFPSLSLSATLCWFLVDTSLLGLVLSPVALIYTPVSLVTTFFVTTSMFLSLILYGYVTKKNLIGFVPIMVMGFVGIMLASVMNMFFRSSTFLLAISAVAIVVLAGYIAYTMQMIKGLYSDADSENVRGKKVLFGASLIFHEFVNLFLHILRFVGRRN
ncbi:MAG: Bax inhibitor-1/YccA family protein [Holosporaceae bacterium]|jgi:FtsH-binding integral membrane protein|nr:Bax inhibitor-1/YccA family protein [Holosporaceae bacterium]